MTGRGYPSSDRQVSDLMPPMTTNESAPDPTAGEWCTCAETNATGATSPEYRCPSCVTPDADDASEPLTEAEREALSDAVEDVTKQLAGADRMEEFMFPIVERIKADAATKARAEGVRAAIYELGLWCGECDPADPDDDCCVVDQRVRALLDAARSARDGGR